MIKMEWGNSPVCFTLPQRPEDHSGLEPFATPSVSPGIEASASPMNSLDMQNLGPQPDLNQNLYLTFTGIVKCKKPCSQLYIPPAIVYLNMHSGLRSESSLCSPEATAAFSKGLSCHGNPPLQAFHPPGCTLPRWPPPPLPCLGWLEMCEAFLSPNKMVYS